MSTWWINDDGTMKSGSGWTWSGRTVLSSSQASSFNGNLLTDGTRNFGYDLAHGMFFRAVRGKVRSSSPSSDETSPNAVISRAKENQLIAVWQVNAWSNNFVYDGKMRRRIERDYTWNSGTSGWQQTNEIHFVYDGNLVIQERDINNQPQVTYTRGQDLSGSLQGAGGIGGLLARSDRAQAIPGEVTSGGISEFGTPSYFHADGNGNVTMLIAASQMIVAKYLYDPFGNTLAKCGLLADVNNYRFSSKEWNGNLGLYYYLYRFYDPNMQRWVNRDPVGELGFSAVKFQRGRLSIFFGVNGLMTQISGDNLYDFIRNQPTDGFDPFGLAATGSGSAACEHAMEEMLAAQAQYNANKTALNMLIWREKLAQVAIACRPPPPPLLPPIPEPDPWAPWTPSPEAQKCAWKCVGGVLLMTCFVILLPVGA